MKNFNDIGALLSVLQDVYEKSPSEREQRVAGLAGILEQYFDFTKDDGAPYASVGETFIKAKFVKSLCNAI